DERRAHLLAVGVLGIRRVERLLLDVVDMEDASHLVDEPNAATPRSAVERVDVEERPQRRRGRHERDAERGAGRAAGEQEQPLARDPVAALVDELLERLLFPGMREAVLLFVFLRYDESFSDQDAGG